MDSQAYRGKNRCLLGLLRVAGTQCYTTGLIVSRAVCIAVLMRTTRVSEGLAFLLLSVVQ